MTKILKSQNLQKYSNLYIKLYKDNNIKLESDKSNRYWNTSFTVSSKILTWNTEKQCWFGSRESIKELIKGGAQWYSKKTNEKSPKQIFANMILEKYGKGYLLMNYKQNNNLKMNNNKYFEGGWLMRTKTGKVGWFFKSSYYEKLIIGGAEFISKDIKHSPSTMTSTSSSNSSSSLDSCIENNNSHKYILTSYKKGFHVKHTSGQQIPNQKYWLGGWWQPSHNAWFFKKDMKNIILQNLFNLENQYSISKYGKGFHVRHNSSEKVPINNYWLGGWWRPKHKAWFFKKEYEEKLKYLLFNSNDDFENISVLSDEYNEISESYFKDMILTHYKNGLLLKPPLNHKDYGQKYYNNGYWSNNLKGWVFHKSDELKIQSITGISTS